MKQQYTGKKQIYYRIVLILMVFLLLSSHTLQVAQAKTEEPPEEYRGEPITQERAESSAVIQEASFGIAWADPDGAHSVYDWPFTFDQMGLVMQSYQNYGSGTSGAYFHHGIDMVAPNGTQVYTRFGGQVVNVENYQPGNKLYWEVAILDDEGYVWQYHHIDQSTIPQLIHSKFAEWKANPQTGGYIPPNTRIGNIIYWPVVSMGYRFNHVHLNILAAGDVYLNGLEFHTPLVDNQIPEIQQIGLLNGNTVVSGNTASGDYGMYVRARDLMMSPVYYLPPHKTEFSIDGGEWVTVWEFHDFPGGFNDKAYVNDFFVPGYTKGDYNNRDFYIDLGFTTEGQRAFPSEPGAHSIEVCVWDYYDNHTCDTFDWNVVTAIPDNGCGSGNGVTRTFQVTEDLMVSDVNLGINLSHASRGQVKVTLQSPTDMTATTVIANSSDTYDNYDVWVDDSSNNPVNDGSNDNVSEPYFDRTVGPSSNGALDSFNGKAAYGEWTVFVCDNARGTAGTLNLIELEVIGIDNNNTAPVANPAAISTLEDTPVEITLSGYDADNDPLTFTVIEGPSNGSLSGVAPELTYTPAADFNGSDSFSFNVNDGAVDSEPASIQITIVPVNDAPFANNQSVSTAEDTSRSITLTGTDIDGDALTYSIVNQPAHGTLSGNAPNLIYVPAANYYGYDSFTFKASDGTADSNTATVTITVTAVNDAPVANSQSLTMAEDTTLAITLTGTDIEASPLTFSIVSQPAHGTLSGSTPNLNYVPAANYNGPDNFTFKANDGSLDSNVASVTITITPVNDAPLANPQTVETFANTTVDITLTGTDVEESELTFTIQSAPSHGTLTGSGAFRVYTPAAGYQGEDSFTFVVNDGEMDSEPATVSITVAKINVPPVANPQALKTNEDNAIFITLTGSDPDNDPITFVVVEGPSHGTLSGTLPTLIYTPYTNYHGSDSFVFVVNDGVVYSPEAIIFITVFPVNDDPIAYPQEVNVVEDSTTNIILTGTDVDEDSLTYTVETGPGHGSLSGDAPNLTYTPAPNYNGPDSLTFKVYDGTSYSEAALVSISVSAVNDAPVAIAQSITTAEDTPKAITLAGSDVDGDNLFFAILSQPGHGSLSGSAPNLTYIPTSNFNGADSFTFKVNDGLLNSNTATVSITVTAVNDAPVANGQSVSTYEDTAKALTLSGIDVDGDALTFVVLTQPVHGTLSGTAPNLTYTPTANYNGSDSITFKVTDGTLDSEPAVVIITVEPVNDAPLAVGQSVVTNENLPVLINLAGSDIDGDALTFTIQTAPLNGVLTGNAPNLVYTPANYYSGHDSFSFYVNDGFVNSNTAEVSILILDENYLPLVYNQSLSTSENTPLPISLTGMDPDGDELVYVIKSQPENGTLSGEAPTLVYMPDPGFVGSDLFTFAAQDNEFESNPGLIEIEVVPSGPSTVFFDDFETDLGWTRNADRIDTATAGVWERANPESVAYYGDKQLGTTVSGSYDLVTGPLAGSSAGSYDLDGGKTSMLSPVIQLPSGKDLTLSFSYYVAHYTNSSSADYMRLLIVGSETLNIFEELGGNDNDNAEWEYFEADISRFAGQIIRLLIEAADDSTPSLFEAAVDDILIVATTPNNPPAAAGQFYQMDEDESLEIALIGSDPDGDPLSYVITETPSHGSLSGQAPDLTYTPNADYNGFDSFVFIVNDGRLNSESASITLDIAAVNDAPIALGQTLSTSVDVTVDVTLSGTDVDGDGLQFIVSSSPSHGILTGVAPNLVYNPVDGYVGNDSFTFVVYDGLEESAPATISIKVNPAGPATIFFDDFESDKGWIFNPFNTDTAVSGLFERAEPESTYYYGYKQLGYTVSGTHALVTGPLAGSGVGSHDIDRGVTSVRSPLIQLPAGQDLTLSFSYYFAHASNSSSADYLRVKVVGNNSQQIFEERGTRRNDNARWESFSYNLNGFAGQTIYILIQAADLSTESLVEAAIDDVLIIAK